MGAVSRFGRPGTRYTLYGSYASLFASVTGNYPITRFKSARRNRDPRAKAPDSS
jgi:hypothetical protein